MRILSAVAALVLALAVAGCSADGVAAADADTCAHQWELVFRQTVFLDGLRWAVEHASEQVVVEPRKVRSACRFAPDPDSAIRRGEAGTMHLVVTATGAARGFEPTPTLVMRCYDMSTDQHGHGEAEERGCPSAT